MAKVVVSQPMYFPWYGHLEQLKHCDIYVFYDDVQFSKGSVFNRIQLKNANSQTWMTVPLISGDLSLNINQRYPDERKNWRKQHLKLFSDLYSSAPFYKLAFDMLQSVLDGHPVGGSLSLLSEASTKALAVAFGLNHVEYKRSSELDITGKSSQRVADICSSLNATHYITGHGASKYMNHTLFDKREIQVQYISYGLKSYPQKTGTQFLPYVSALDCIANCGEVAYDSLGGSLVPWKDFLIKAN
ncbi:WbqC family protein [Synechococcus sp. AH-707-M23]|nr:WbqC family protein [Synechococcus sp. AH-707-M23]